MSIISLVEKSDDANHWAPQDMLKDALKEYEEGRPHSKALLLMLDESGGKYSISYGNAGLSASQIIALMRVAETIFLREMGYLFDD